ncbi:MAG: response regulator [Proteobacteria bacterium]|nr:response regulator [Pseudomonadota bacterium]
MEVLIVDDDRGLVEFVTVTLRRAGFSVSRAHDAPAVHRRMQEAEEPDLILLDINLGAWNGFDILKEIRSRSMVPVILVVSFSPVSVPTSGALELRPRPRPRRRNRRGTRPVR